MSNRINQVSFKVADEYNTAGDFKKALLWLGIFNEDSVKSYPEYKKEDSYLVEIKKGYIKYTFKSDSSNKLKNSIINISDESGMSIDISIQEMLDVYKKLEDKDIRKVIDNSINNSFSNIISDKLFKTRLNTSITNEFNSQRSDYPVIVNNTRGSNNKYVKSLIKNKIPTVRVEGERAYLNTRGKEELVNIRVALNRLSDTLFNTSSDILDRARTVNMVKNNMNQVSLYGIVSEFNSEGDIVLKGKYRFTEPEIVYTKDEITKEYSKLQKDMKKEIENAVKYKLFSSILNRLNNMLFCLENPSLEMNIHSLKERAGEWYTYSLECFPRTLKDLYDTKYVKDNVYKGILGTNIRSLLLNCINMPLIKNKLKYKSVMSYIFLKDINKYREISNIDSRNDMTWENVLYFDKNIHSNMTVSDIAMRDISRNLNSRVFSLLKDKELNEYDSIDEFSVKKSIFRQIGGITELTVTDSKPVEKIQVMPEIQYEKLLLKIRELHETSKESLPLLDDKLENLRKNRLSDNEKINVDKELESVLPLSMFNWDIDLPAEITSEVLRAVYIDILTAALQTEIRNLFIEKYLDKDNFNLMIDIDLLERNRLLEGIDITKVNKLKGINNNLKVIRLRVDDETFDRISKYYGRYPSIMKRLIELSNKGVLSIEDLESIAKNTNMKILARTVINFQGKNDGLLTMVKIVNTFKESTETFLLRMNYNSNKDRLGFVMGNARIKPTLYLYPLAQTLPLLGFPKEKGYIVKWIMSRLDTSFETIISILSRIDLIDEMLKPESNATLKDILKEIEEYKTAEDIIRLELSAGRHLKTHVKGINHDKLDKMRKRHGTIESYNMVMKEESLSILSALEGEIKSNIPYIQGDLGNGLKYKILGKTDITGLTLGDETSCCQRLTGVAKSCVIEGYKNPDSGFLILEKDGIIISQSWIFVVKDTLVLDNIEFRLKYRSVMESKFKITDLYKKIAEELPYKEVQLGLGYIENRSVWSKSFAEVETTKGDRYPMLRDYKGYTDASVYRVWLKKPEGKEQVISRTKRKVG